MTGEVAHCNLWKQFLKLLKNGVKMLIIPIFRASIVVFIKKIRFEYS
jgi:hypothetical protein